MVALTVKIGVAWIAILCALATPVWPEPSEIQRREVRIGYLVDLSGLGSYFGANSILGATLAQEELESSELHIKLIVEDHATSSPRAASAAQKLIGVDKVEALYTETTPAVVPVSPIAQKAKIPFVGVAGATSFLSNPYAFKSFLDLEAACEAVANHWKSIGIKKFALLKIQFEAGDICARGFRHVAPEGEIVSFDRGADVSTEILTLKRNGVQAILNEGYEGELLNMFHGAQKSGFDGLLGMNHDAVTKVVLAKYPDELSHLTTAGFKDLPPAFMERMKARFPTKTISQPEAVAMGYLHIKQIILALSACQKGDIVCQTKVLSQSAPDPILGFLGWKNRAAQFELELRGFKNGTPVLISSVR